MYTISCYIGQHLTVRVSILNFDPLKKGLAQGKGLTKLPTISWECPPDILINPNPGTSWKLHNFKCQPEFFLLYVPSIFLGNHRCWWPGDNIGVKTSAAMVLTYFTNILVCQHITTSALLAPLLWGGNPPNSGEIPSQRISKAEFDIFLVFSVACPEQVVEQAMELPVYWDALTPSMTSL